MKHKRKIDIYIARKNEDDPSSVSYVYSWSTTLYAKCKDAKLAAELSMPGFKFKAYFAQ